jgi:hypothetical protein
MCSVLLFHALRYIEQQKGQAVSIISETFGIIPFVDNTNDII